MRYSLFNRETTETLCLDWKDRRFVAQLAFLPAAALVETFQPYAFCDVAVVSV